MNDIDDLQAKVANTQKLLESLIERLGYRVYDNEVVTESDYCELIEAELEEFEETTKQFSELFKGKK